MPAIQMTGWIVKNFYVLNFLLIGFAASPKSNHIGNFHQVQNIHDTITVNICLAIGFRNR